MKRILKEIKDIFWRCYFYRYDYFCGSNTIWETIQVFWFIVKNFNFLVRGKYIKEYESRIAKETGFKYAVSFGAGRQALFAILRGIGLKDDPVYRPVQLQAYTCKAVPQAILAAGGDPDYTDIDSETYCMNLENMYPILWAIIYQHTFGNWGDYYGVAEKAKEFGIPLIVDMAHTIRNFRYQTPPLAAFISTDHTKFINTNGGGVALTNDKDLYWPMRGIQEAAAVRTKRWALWCALTFIVEVIMTHPRLYWFMKPIRHIMNRLGMFSFSKEEGPKPAQWTNVQAYIGLLQLDKLEKNKAHRQELCDSPYALRCTIERNVELPDKYFTRGEWFNQPVFGGEGGYISGSCPNAERACKEVGTIPIHPRVKAKHLRKWGWEGCK